MTQITLKQLRPLACHTRVHCGTCRTDADWRERVTGVRDFDCPHGVYWNGKKAKRRLKGLGDLLEVIFKRAGIKKKPGCGCDRRQEKANKMLPFKVPAWLKRLFPRILRIEQVVQRLSKRF